MSQYLKLQKTIRRTKATSEMRTGKTAGEIQVGIMIND